ncbi:DMT family transporter [Dactylosporangium siamense]|uniref:Membrane protein n=1 Tax=Dactylosporangium siamense TaxID=685454 RepID=A0A919PGS5_9ACTN|nr:DMT family transporter [Dactylosporangium siamense]GIG43324.1 membrane protein [Dactylosporangium siamense]
MNRLYTLYCVLTCAILGSSFTVSRSLVDYPVLTGQALRYTLATAALALLTSWLRPTGRELLRLALVAATGLVGFNVLLMYALRHADPAAIGTIVGVSPLLLALLGPLQERRRPSPRLLLAATVVVLGAVLVEGGGRIDGPGLLAAVGVLLCEAAFSLLAAPLLPRLGPVRVSAWSTALAVPMLLVVLPFSGELPRLPTVGEGSALAFLGLVLTVVAFVCWYTGVAHLGVERAGVFVGLVPVFALATVAVTDRVAPDPRQLAGVLAVAAGLVIGLRRAGRDASNPAATPAPATA